MLSKQSKNVTIDEILELISEKVSEDAYLELKSDLPCNKGLDPWHSDQSKIGEKARNEIAEEMIAFANAGGGTLLLGVRESNEKPNFARGLNPLPACHDLAERLRLQMRDIIEPRLDGLISVGLPSDDKGNGIVLMRVVSSRLRPHRHRITKEVYYRRADSSEKMTMEEIRDLVLYTSSQNQMLLEQIENGHRMISDWANDIESGPGPEFVSEFVAVPVSQIGAAVPLDDESLYPIANKFEAQLVNADRNLSVELFTLHSASNWRPMLRGIKGVEHFEPDIMDYRHLLDSGEIALGCSVRRSKDSDYPNAQYEGWLCGYFAQALIAAERIRRHFGLSDFEFAISVHFWKARAGSTQVEPYPA